MNKKYCKYCWANGGVKCHASEENRRKNCMEAKMRAASESNMSKHNESKALHDYISYIKNRITYLKAFSPSVPLSEYKYYRALLTEIKRWGEQHIIFYKYLRGKITIDDATSLYGVSEREFYRMMKHQRALLIKFIEEQENILGEKYPFIPMTDVFNEIIGEKENDPE